MTLSRLEPCGFSLNPSIHCWRSRSGDEAIGNLPGMEDIALEIDRQRWHHRHNREHRRPLLLGMMQSGGRIGWDPRVVVSRWHGTASGAASSL